MRISYILFVFAIIDSIHAQKIYSVDYVNQADIKVFVVDYQSQSDLKVYKVNYGNQAKNNSGLWYFVDYESQAEKTIYFVDYKNQAGWINNSKKHLLF